MSCIRILKNDPFKVMLIICLLIVFFSQKNINQQSCDQDANELIKKLSKKLTHMAKKYGQLSCSLDKKVSLNGGWCSELSGKNSSEHITDVEIAKELSFYLRNKKVASFGDGPGLYKEIFIFLKDVQSYDAFDGAPFCEETSNNNVKFLDLTVPVYHLLPFDWIISLEVAEHIPKEYEDTYIDNLVRHAREGIIISWATPGQGGLSHLNEKDFEEVKSKLFQKGFQHLPQDSQRVREKSFLPWIQNNLNIFKRFSKFDS
ncbi:SAM dependent methyltransferase [Brachionus plicatilis]|uniref:SAM dependent methyltransferase n=1 Tax=Brachionus plicatilis TaxID=10195 RepID=A0A3M7SM95_BRAPC|nr:SAM dependent methyltransferase [Brachionus plicatilis]